MKHKTKFLALFFFGTLLAACATKPSAKPTPISIIPSTSQATSTTEVIVQATVTRTAVENTPTSTLTETVTTTPKPSTTATHSPQPTATPIPPPPTETITPANTPTSVPPSPSPLPTESGEPQLISFTASPARISPGDDIILTWETDGDMVKICPQANYFSNPDICFDAPPTGSQTITTDETITSYHFILTVTKSGATYWGGEQAVCIDVNDWFFENPSQGCASTPPIYSHAAWQRFEHGAMLWIEAPDEFIIFYDDNTFRVIPGPLTLKPGASVDNRVGDVPAGYLEPVSGFGLIWRAEIEWIQVEYIRKGLGWAIEPEFGFETVSQHGIESGWTFTNQYIRDPNGELVYLLHAAQLRPHWYYKNL